MKFIDRLERRLEGAFDDTFARIFGGAIQPAELELALHREAEDGLRVTEDGRHMAPNAYVVTLNSTDFHGLTEDEQTAVHIYSRHLEQWIRDQGWEVFGDVTIEFRAREDLHTGQFRTAGTVDPDARRDAPRPGAPRRQPEPPSTPDRPGPAPARDRASYEIRADRPADHPRRDAVGGDSSMSQYDQQRAGGYPQYDAPQGDPYGRPAQPHTAPPHTAQPGPMPGGGPVPGDGRYTEPPADPYGRPDPYAQAPGGYTEQPSARPAADQAPRELTAALRLEDGSGRTYTLRPGYTIVGRGQDADFRLPDTGVSRRHAEIHWDGEVAILSDLGSTNGTSVNGGMIQEWQLADGDMIRIGHSDILVLMR